MKPRGKTKRVKVMLLECPWLGAQRAEPGSLQRINSCVLGLFSRWSRGSVFCIFLGTVEADQKVQVCSDAPPLC